MSFGVYDFAAAMERAGIRPPDVEQVIAGWGENGDYAEWQGGFILKMRDGRYGYLHGWCDTTGWGCQDAAYIEWFDQEPAMSELPNAPSMGRWEFHPEDCRKYLAGEITPYEG